MYRPTFCDIDTQALLHNLQRVREFAPNQNIIAMIKSNAYGHGVLTIADALQQHVNAFGVSCLEEALQLRLAGFEQTIVLFEGFYDPKEIALIEQYQLDCVIHQAYQIRYLSEYQFKQPINVWLKVNTGMNRLGFKPNQVHDMHQQLDDIANVNVIGWMTHFSEADNLSAETTYQQWQCFEDIKPLPGLLKSFANSAAIMAWPKTLGDVVRPGIMLYGISPFADKTSHDLQLRPVMSLSSNIFAIQDCQAGDRVGYGGLYTCPRAMRIGLVAAGYGDGYPRHVAQETTVLINQQQAPIVGRISMDMLTIDLSDIDQAKIGDTVQLWGTQLPIETIAKHANTSPYELVSQVTTRVRTTT